MSRTNGPAKIYYRDFVQVEQAASRLSVCNDIEEVKSIRNRAEAIRAYYKNVDASIEVQNAAAEIKLRAERRLGELLRETAKNRGRLRGATSCHSDEPTLSKLGIDRAMSSRVQAIAAIPENIFEETTQKTKANGKRLTSKEMINIGRTHQKAKQKTTMPNRAPRKAANVDELLLHIAKRLEKLAHGTDDLSAEIKLAMKQLNDATPRARDGLSREFAALIRRLERMRESIALPHGTNGTER